MRRKLRGSTLVELLVVMIISILLFISVVDGLSIFGSYSSSVISKINDNTEFYDSYYKLETLARSADSTFEVGGSIFLYSQGRNIAGLHIKDSLLITIIGEAVDTTFKKVSQIELKNNCWCDTLLIMVIKHDNTLLKLRFAIEQSNQIQSQQKNIEFENKYSYE